MFLERDGVQLFCDVQGEGEPALLFVHGWLMSSDLWREQVAAFAKTHQVVRFDLRGFGQSSKPAGEYTLEGFADDLAFVIEKLGLKKPVLVGWSMGASIAAVYAAAHPDKLSKVVLVDGTPMLIAAGDWKHGIPPEAANQLMGALQADFAAGTDTFVNLMFPEPGTDDLKKWVQGVARQTTPAIALNSMASAGGRDLRPVFAQIKLPTLVLFGGSDQVCLPGAGHYVHSAIPGAEMCEFPGIGHCPFLTETAEFNRRLQAFVVK
jgi:pimeloyl-ACP methyl ester esterase